MTHLSTMNDGRPCPTGLGPRPVFQINPVKGAPLEGDAIHWIVLLLCIPFAWMWEAFALVKLWSWFLVPAGAPRLGLVTVIGLTLIVFMLGSTRDNGNEFTPEIGLKTLKDGCRKTAVVLFVGWILHLFTV